MADDAKRESPRQRPVRTNPVTEAAREGERERHSDDRGTRRGSGGSADPDQQTDASGTERELDEPFRKDGER